MSCATTLTQDTFLPEIEPFKTQSLPKLSFLHLLYHTWIAPKAVQDASYAISQETCKQRPEAELSLTDDSMQCTPATKTYADHCSSHFKAASSPAKVLPSLGLMIADPTKQERPVLVSHHRERRTCSRCHANLLHPLPLHM